LSEIARLEKLQGAELNDAKKILATEATAVLHGRAAADAAAETARRTFEEGTLAEGLPTISAKLPEGILNLAVACGLAASNSEARKLIANNGLKLNDVSVSDPKLVVAPSDVTSDGVLKLSSGKKKHVLVKPA
jgi:tyrosyl-tRNA synthetase